MLAFAPIYILWAVSAVTASPILYPNATHTSSLEQRGEPQKVFLGKQNVGTSHEQWGIFFEIMGTGFSTEKLGGPTDTPKMELIRSSKHHGWEMTDLNVQFNNINSWTRTKFFNWITDDMISQLPQTATQPGSSQSSSSIGEIFYGGPEPDARNPHAPPKRQRAGGSSQDMAWVLLEEMGKRKLYVGNQGIPAVFKREFDQNYIKIWRRRWGNTDMGKKSIEWMMQTYPASKYPQWAKQWTDPL
ncbi:hypothetical protein D9757_003855 [Collybiopsis confluens]|uniref:Uncharacterized protein n=1 Tax=Collybiopsis confluens TaxID=2823264 RepID=A0A8H5HVE8_9AGAR|nr:hypothetical protein D9757_003855 [Collybiopsis confluens]